ncbi:hypothetical protein CALCODRAFT_538907, partial [Calocera cornea HHB12733]
VWVLIVFAFAGINYLLSNILTIGLSSATIFLVTYWDFNTMAGLGPWIPHDLTPVLYPTNTNMSLRIAFTYDSFTSDSTQVFPLTRNLTQFPGSHNHPTTIRTLCDDGCFAYLLPRTISQVLTSGPQPPVGHTYCDIEHPEECVGSPFVFDVNGIQALYSCDPTDSLCIADAVLKDRMSPKRSTYSTLNTNITAWQNFNISNILRTVGPAAMLYFEPFTLDGEAAVSNMTACQTFTSLPYAFKICFKEIDESNFAIGWSPCDPGLHDCTAEDATWQASLTSSTIMSLEQRQVAVIRTLPTGTLIGVEDFQAAMPLTINSTQFFIALTNVFGQATAVDNLLYNTAVNPVLVPTCE